MSDAEFYMLKVRVRELEAKLTAAEDRCTKLHALTADLVVVVATFFKGVVDEATPAMKAKAKQAAERLEAEFPFEEDIPT